MSLLVPRRKPGPRSGVCGKYSARFRVRAWAPAFAGERLAFEEAFA